jgi:hypothetical protein
MAPVGGSVSALAKKRIHFIFYKKNPLRHPGDTRQYPPTLQNRPTTMTQETNLGNMKYALPRTTILAIGIAAWLFVTPSTFAGTKEINAIMLNCRLGVTIATATATN